MPEHLNAGKTDCSIVVVCSYHCCRVGIGGHWLSLLSLLWFVVIDVCCLLFVVIIVMIVGGLSLVVIGCHWLSGLFVVRCYHCCDCCRVV